MTVSRPKKVAANYFYQILLNPRALLMVLDGAGRGGSIPDGTIIRLNELYCEFPHKTVREVSHLYCPNSLFPSTQQRRM